MNCLRIIPAIVLVSAFVVSCARSHRCSVADIAGIYSIEKANTVWAKKAGYSDVDIEEIRIELRSDGTAFLVNFPGGRKVTGSASWSLRKAEVIDLLISDTRTVVPVEVACFDKKVVLKYSEDPELPTNLTFKKEPNQALEPTIPGVTPRAEPKPRVAPPGIVAHLER